MKELNVRLQGIMPGLLMHSDRGANPLNPDARKLKELTSKRVKTDEDYEDIARAEWELAMYWDDELGPYIPSMNIRASLVGGAKFNKLGAGVQRSLLTTTERTKLDYDGPTAFYDLYKSGQFTDVRSVVIGRKRIMRTRPVFHNWSLIFEMTYDENQLEESDLMLAFKNAGKMVGLGDFRPQTGGMFGRYSAKVATKKEMEESLKSAKSRLG